VLAQLGKTDLRLYSLFARRYEVRRAFLAQQHYMRPFELGRGKRARRLYYIGWHDLLKREQRVKRDKIVHESLH
jgi:hypothetical protein